MDVDIDEEYFQNNHNWVYDFKNTWNFLAVSPGRDGFMRPTNEVLRKLANPESKVKTLDDHITRLKMAFFENYANLKTRYVLSMLLYDAFWLINNCADTSTIQRLPVSILPRDDLSIKLQIQITGTARLWMYRLRTHRQYSELYWDNAFTKVYDNLKLNAARFHRERVEMPWRLFKMKGRAFHTHTYGGKETYNLFSKFGFNVPPLKFDMNKWKAVQQTLFTDKNIYFSPSVYANYQDFEAHLRDDSNRPLLFKLKQTLKALRSSVPEEDDVSITNLDFFDGENEIYIPESVGRFEFALLMNFFSDQVMHTVPSLRGELGRSRLVERAEQVRILAAFTSRLSLLQRGGRSRSLVSLLGNIRFRRAWISRIRGPIDFDYSGGEVRYKI